MSEHRTRRRVLTVLLFLSAGAMIAFCVAILAGIVRNEERLPLGPIWPDFALKTLAYAVLAWLYVFAPLALLGYIRRRRGHCPKCNYDLQGNPDAGCPECGWGREEAGVSIPEQ